MAAVNYRSTLNRFVSVDTPSPRSLFNSAMQLNNKGLFSPHDEFPVVVPRKIDQIDDLLAYDRMKQLEESQNNNIEL